MRPEEEMTSQPNKGMRPEEEMTSQPNKGMRPGASSKSSQLRKLNDRIARFFTPR
jgi:hypothetical protein